MQPFRHAGLDPASRRRLDESREPFQRLDPGIHREPWIPVTGMVPFWQPAVYGQTLLDLEMGALRSPPGGFYGGGSSHPSGLVGS